MKKNKGEEKIKEAYVFGDKTEKDNQVNYTTEKAEKDAEWAKDKREIEEMRKLRNIKD